jgi:heme a synthase
MQSTWKNSVSDAAHFAWATVCCNLAVVLWGAYVRATGSGAGCGNKWPECGGQILGTGAGAATIIEFTHRITSAIALLMVATLVFWCWRVTTKQDWARYSATLAAFFLVNEAFLGAALVLLGHVARDQSAGRIVLLCLHFGNTLILLATLSLTAVWLSSGGTRLVLIARPRQLSAVVVGLFASMFIGVTGAVAALSDTLYPASSLRSSLLQDFGAGGPTLLHFRVLHPIVAVIAGTYIVWLILQLSRWRGHLSQSGAAVLIIFIVQVGLGITNVMLLAPIWLQILHLFVGDVFWIAVVLASADLVIEHARTAQPLATIAC